MYTRYRNQACASTKNEKKTVIEEKKNKMSDQEK